MECGNDNRLRKLAMQLWLRTWYHIGLADATGRNHKLISVWLYDVNNDHIVVFIFCFLFIKNSCNLWNRICFILQQFLRALWYVSKYWRISQVWKNSLTRIWIYDCQVHFMLWSWRFLPWSIVQSNFFKFNIWRKFSGNKVILLYINKLFNHFDRCDHLQRNSVRIATK